MGRAETFHSKSRSSDRSIKIITWPGKSFATPFAIPTEPERLVKHNFQPTIIPTSDVPEFNEWLERRSHDICNAGVYFIAHGSKVIVSNDEIDACKIQF